MPRFAANLSMLYPELDFAARFEAAARDGFEAVEYLFPYDHDPAELRDLLRINGLKQVLFNAPSGDWARSERGLAPGFFLNRQDHAQQTVEALDAPNLRVQMDLNHCQTVEGDVATKIRQYLPPGASAISRSRACRSATNPTRAN